MNGLASAGPFSRPEPVLPSSGVHHPLRSAVFRRASVLGAVIAVVCSLAPPSASAASGSLAAAQARITAAQEAANRASTAYDDPMDH